MCYHSKELASLLTDTSQPFTFRDGWMFVFATRLNARPFTGSLKSSDKHDHVVIAVMTNDAKKKKIELNYSFRVVFCLRLKSPTKPIIK